MREIRSPKSQRKGLVYLFGPENREFVKIGFTSAPIERRLSFIQTGSPERLDIIATIDADIQLERALHKTFAPVRMAGEWFRADLKLGALVACLEGVDVGVDALAAINEDFIANADPPSSLIDAVAWVNSADGDLSDYLRTVLP